MILAPEETTVRLRKGKSKHSWVRAQASVKEACLHSISSHSSLALLGSAGHAKCQCTVREQAKKQALPNGNSETHKAGVPSRDWGFLFILRSEETFSGMEAVCASPCCMCVTDGKVAQEATG